MKNTILISILLLSSCTFSSKKEMETIHLNDVGNIDKYLEWDISNKFDSLNYVLLETNDSILIADISNLRESAQDYFITSDDRLFRFDKQGHFCNFIGNRGSGPEEYVSIQDFCLDNQRQIVYILDYFGRKIMYYDFNGNYVGACKLIDDYAFNTFCFWEDHLYLTSVNNAFTPDLLVVDPKNGESRALSFRERTMGTDEGFLGTSYLYEADGDLSIYHYFNDTIFRVSDAGLTPYRLLDLGSLKLTFTEAAIRNGALSGTKMQIFGFFETKKTVFIRYMLTDFKGEKYQTFTAVYDKEAKKTYPSANLCTKTFPLFRCPTGKRLFPSSDFNAFLTTFQISEIESLPDGRDLGELADNNPVLVKFVSR